MIKAPDMAIPLRYPRPATRQVLRARSGGRPARQLRALPQGARPRLLHPRHQRQIVIDGQYHTADLELYHRGIPAIIVVELKVGQMKARDVGQLNSYVNWYVFGMDADLQEPNDDDGSD